MIVHLNFLITYQQGKIVPDFLVIYVNVVIANRMNLFFYGNKQIQLLSKAKNVILDADFTN